ncbi:MAG TPA: hypothetical protein VG167_06705 [Verrucomicrobiae bacterium]|nr:hypothetical protein [Verrucomicrobiae bacterium]
MTKTILYAACATFLLCQGSASAQPLFHLTLRGSSATTDPNGHIFSGQFTEKTLLNEFALQNGLTNTAGYGVAYHVGGNALGDTIDVINLTNGQPVTSLIGFYFGEDPTLGRPPALRSASGAQQRRIEYIYTSQDPHSLGSALITDYYWLNGDGTTNAEAHFGDMQYLVLPDSLRSTVRVRNAHFTTTGPWNFGP